jgi:hypothetical protein
MTDPQDTGRAREVPDAAQLHGHAPESDLAPEDVLPIGEARETEHLVDDED